VEYVGDSKLPYGMIPIMLYNGEITLQTQSGRVQTQILETHTALYTESMEDMTKEEVTHVDYGILLS
jgi:WD repeat-containing protein 19